MSEWLCLSAEDCECITDNLSVILWGIAIAAVVVILLLRTKYFDDLG